MLSGQPILILKEGTERTRGKDAQGNNIQAAIAIADAVRSTLGPKGMDKMLVDSLGDVVITNDGVTILKEIDIEHPAAKMMVEIAKTQDQECGDGTTTAVILAGALLKNAQDLLAHNVHPTIIADGYRMANEKACEIIEKLSEKVALEDADILKKIAETSTTGKTAAFNRVQLADIAFQAIHAIVEKNRGKSVGGQSESHSGAHRSLQRRERLGDAGVHRHGSDHDRRLRRADRVPAVQAGRRQNRQPLGRCTARCRPPAGHRPHLGHRAAVRGGHHQRLDRSGAVSGRRADTGTCGHRAAGLVRGAAHQ